MTDYVIEPFDPEMLDDNQWQAICDLLNPFRLTIEPDFTPIDVAEARRRYTPTVDFYRDDYWWARTPAGKLTGWLWTGRFTSEEHNRHLLEFDIILDAAGRRRGIGTRFLRHAADLAEREQRTLLVSYAYSRVPASGAFLERIGAEPALRTITNELWLKDLDRALLQAWIDRAPERAVDYELVEIPTPYPEELLEPLATMLRLMNTAPKEDLEFDDIPWTAEQVRERDEELRERSGQRYMLVARHRPSGRFAGYTEIIRYPFQSQFLWQLGTAVASEHRNRGLGRWLKAANLLRVMDAHPEATRIRTGNAGSNEPMLHINHEMDYSEIFRVTMMQAPLEKVRAYLAEAAEKTPAPAA